MSSLLLKWIANGVITLVLLSTLLLAQSMSTSVAGSNVMVAQATPAADAASAPGAGQR